MIEFAGRKYYKDEPDYPSEAFMADIRAAADALTRLAAENDKLMCRGYGICHRAEAAERQRDEWKRRWVAIAVLEGQVMTGIEALVERLRDDKPLPWRYVEQAADALTRMAEERDEALGYATRLLLSYAGKYCNLSPNFEPLPDLIGVLTQIDNASTVTAEIERQRDEAIAALRRLMSLCENGGDPFEEPNRAVVQQARAVLEAKP